MNNRLNQNIKFVECGGIFSTLKGTITSPNYPKNYDSNTFCQWLLRTEPNHSMTLKFSDFDLEQSPNCTRDSVKVYDGSVANEYKLLLNVCGNKLPNGTGFSTPLKSTNNEMLVVMASNDNFESKGFSADFETVYIVFIVFCEF